MTFPTLKLPARPLTLKREAIATPVSYYFSIPILLAIAVFMVVTEAPGILRDYRISKNPLVVEDGSIDGQCTTRKAIFTTCEVSLAYEHGGQRYDKDVEVMFVDMHSGDYETGLVIAADEPQLATISLGLDMLWNRIITLAVFTTLLGGGALIMLFILTFYKEFLVISFDPTLAATLRLPIRWLDYLLIALIAMSIVVSLQTVGVTLMVAMLITPAAAASLLTRRLSRMMLIAALIAIFSGISGLYLSYYLNLASGSAIVLTCTAVFAIIWGITALARRYSRARATENM